MNTDRLKLILTRHEGLRLKLYKCTSGKLTIGIGRNLENVGISESEAIFLLENDIRRAYGGVKTIIPNFIILNDVRQEVLVNMCFNLGVNRLSKFKKMIKAIKVMDFEKASVEMLDSLWAKQVGRRSKELSKAMKFGKWA